MSPRYPEHGVLNRIERPQIREKLDVYNESLTNVFNSVINITHTPNALANTGPYKGIVLRVEYQPEPKTWATEFYNFVVNSDDQKPNFVQIKVRIPEIHSMLSIPKSLGPESDEPSVIDMYPTFIAQSQDVPIPAIGSLVWVDFGNKTNFSDPIYLKPVNTTESIPSANGVNGAKNSLNNCAGTFNTDSPKGDPLPAINKPLSHAGLPLSPRRASVFKENVFLSGKQVYNITFNLWKKAVENNGIYGKSFIGNINFNGTKDIEHESAKRDTIIFSPYSTDFSGNVELIYFFHGIGEFDGEDFKRRFSVEAKKLSEEGRNFVLVVPELPWSSLVKNRRTRYDRQEVWNGEDDFGKFHQEVIKNLKDNFSKDVKISYITIIGHSSGGIALKNATKFFKDVRPNRIIFSDSCYDNSISIVWDNYVSNNLNVELDMVTLKDGIPDKNAQKFMDKIKSFNRDNVYWQSINNKTIKEIGDNILSFVNPVLIEKENEKNKLLLEQSKNININELDIDTQENIAYTEGADQQNKSILPMQPTKKSPMVKNADVSSSSIEKKSDGVRKETNSSAKIKQAVPFQESRVKVEDYGVLGVNSGLLVFVPSVGDAQQRMHILAAKRLMAMNQAWLAENSGSPPLRVISGWRPQRWESREQYESKLIQEYGSIQEGRKFLAYDSPHSTGLAADFGLGDDLGLEPKRITIDMQKNTKVYKWLKDNAYKFGFAPYKIEPWHWEVRLPRESWASGEEFTDNYAVTIEEPGTGGGNPTDSGFTTNCINSLGDTIKSGIDRLLGINNDFPTGEGSMNDKDKKQLIEKLSVSLNIEPEVAYAFFKVESGGGGGFCGDRPKIRFEPHVFADPKRIKQYGANVNDIPWFGGSASDMKKKWAAMGFKHGSGCGNQEEEYKSLSYAIKINEQLAYAATSVGVAQILCDNYGLTGFSNPKEMFEAYSKSEEQQIIGFFKYCSKRAGGKLLQALREKDFVVAAKYYNGIGKEQLYGSKLLSYYNSYKERGYLV